MLDILLMCGVDLRARLSLGLNESLRATLNQSRWPIEQDIPHLKNWRVLRTYCCRPLHILPTTITAILGLYLVGASRNCSHPATPGREYMRGGLLVRQHQKPGTSKASI
ncbi:hypothetical protein BN12_4000013 [Nostocoides japonicum T1-X7]|uniref:Uncharacterized protein n=1 Tax=Nostocoides japonicum T1-X7 TaxID=1194083 RepID=A0A077LZV0_9MICO|nr:hypothetical protein BN12_4000013 [Tetrasphaera japonica T1-X7]